MIMICKIAIVSAAVAAVQAIAIAATRRWQRMTREEADFALNGLKAATRDRDLVDENERDSRRFSVSNNRELNRWLRTARDGLHHRSTP